MFAEKAMMMAIVDAERKAIPLFLTSFSNLCQGSDKFLGTIQDVSITITTTYFIYNEEVVKVYFTSRECLC